MPPLHIALGLLIAAVWGTNFVVIRVGLRDFEPFMFATLRFAFCALPWMLFIKRPQIAWKWLALFGLFLGVGQFGLLYLAMRDDISPGLASLIIQTQVFFTIGLSMFFFRENVEPSAFAGILLAAGGLALVAWHVDATVTTFGIAVTLSAAFCWACANIIIKKAAAENALRIDMFAFMVWSSGFAVLPLMILSGLFDHAGWERLPAAHWDGWLAALWQALGNMLFAYAAWNWLITRHDAATVTPFALLVPVFGMASSTLFLGEPMPVWKISATALVMTGLAIIVVVPKIGSGRT